VSDHTNSLILDLVPDGRNNTPRTDWRVRTIVVRFRGKHVRINIYYEFWDGVAGGGRISFIHNDELKGYNFKYAIVVWIGEVRDYQTPIGRVILFLDDHV